MIDLKELHNKQIKSLKTYFHNKNHSLHRAIIQIDKNYTPLNLSSQTEVSTSNTEEQKKQVWSSKPLHGRHYNNMNNNGIDKKLTNEFLKKGYLYPETEGFILAIQDQVIATNNY